MGLGQNLRFICPWISQSFCICVTAWVCLFLPFDTLSKPIRLLNSHWGALTEAGTFFPEKKKIPTQNSYTATETSSSPAMSTPQALWWERIYTSGYPGGQKLQKFPTQEAISFMQHHLPAPFKERHSQLWNLKNLEASLIFIFFF